MRKGINRRGLLGGAAAGAALSTGLAPRRAAANQQIVVGMWGGDFAQGLKLSVDPLMDKMGIKVIQDQAPTAPRNAKVFAERTLGRGSFDVVCVQPGAAHQMAEAGLIETLDATKVPNMKNVIPWLAKLDMAPHVWSPNTPVYNTDFVKTPPETLGDLFDPKYNGKFSVSSTNFMIVMMAAALYAAGDLHEMEKAKPAVLKLNSNGLRLYSSIDLMAPALKSGEIHVALVPYARLFMWQNAGLPLKGTFLKEGAIAYIDGMVVPKNAPNKEAAYAYVNAMLEPAAQLSFGEFLGYFTTVTNAKFTGELATRLVLPNPEPKIVLEDYAFVAKVQGEIGDWWQRSVLRR